MRRVGVIFGWKGWLCCVLLLGQKSVRRVVVLGVVVGAEECEKGGCVGCCCWGRRV